MSDKELLGKLAEGMKLSSDRYSPLNLAFIGDAVYGLLSRVRFMGEGSMSVNKLNSLTANIERASAQSAVYRRLELILSDDELAAMKRGRNAKSYSKAKNASVADYRMATGVEALFGHLFINGEIDRLIELFDKGLTENETCAKEKGKESDE